MPQNYASVFSFVLAPAFLRFLKRPTKPRVVALPLPQAHDPFNQKLGCEHPGRLPSPPPFLVYLGLLVNLSSTTTSNNPYKPAAKAYQNIFLPSSFNLCISCLSPTQIKAKAKLKYDIRR